MEGAGAAAGDGSGTSSASPVVPIWPRSLHRYNANLPPSYRDAVVTEQVRLLGGFRALAFHLLQSATSGPPAEAGAANCEFYHRAVERDLAALEKGVARYLGLKYLLPPSDYPMLVQVFLQGIFTAGLDLGLRAKLSRITVRLIYRPDCVLPFVLPWRRIVVALRAVHLDAADGTPYIGKDVRDAHCRNLINLLRCVRLGVAASDDGEASSESGASTVVQEIWTELTDGVDISTAESTFLPVLLLSHVLPTRGDAWAGWVQPGAELWAKLDMSSEWDAVWLSLFSRLARHQPAVVDWTDYLPLVYDRILPCLQLPLGYAAPQSPVERRCPSHLSFLFSGKATVSAACFAIYALSPARPAAMEYLNRLLETARLYFHPSNGGRWTTYLTSFLGHLTGHLVSRLLGEQAATRAGQMDRVVGTRLQSAVAPAEHRLTEANVTALRDILLPLIHQGMLAKSPYLAIQAAQSARDFAVLTPGEVLPSFLDLAAESLDSVSMPHRTAAGLKLLATLSPVFLDVRFFPPGLTALTNALDLTLPGIDPNDPGKTEATLRFIAVATSRVQSILTGDETGDGAEGEELARGRVSLAAYLEDYVHRLLDRLFSLLMTLEEPTKKGRRASSSSAPTLSNFVFAVTMQNLFAALPPSVALDAARKVAHHVAAAAQSHARKYYGALVRSSAAAAASALSGHRRRDDTFPAAGDTIAADIFVPLLLRDVLELDGASSEASGVPMTDGARPQSWTLSPLSEDETVWRVRMLAQTVRTVGPLRSQQLAQLRALAALVSHRMECSRSLYKAGGRLIRGLLEGLCATEVAFSPKNERVGGAPMADDSSDGNGVNTVSDSLRVYASYNFDWQQPSPADWEAATQIVDDTLTHAEALIFGLPRRDPGGEGATSDVPTPRVASATALSSVVVNRESLFRALRMIHAAQRGGRWLLAGGLADDVVAAQQRVDSAVAALADAGATDDYDAVLAATGREISAEDARVVLRAPVVAGVGGEQSLSTGATAVAGIDVARRLWVRAYGLVLLVIAAVMRSRPDDGALLYRCLEPIELANEPFRRGAGPARHSTLAAQGYKSAYGPVMSSLRPFGAEGGVGRLMPRFIAKMRIDSLHEFRVSLSGRAGGGGGAACDAVFDGVLHALCDLAVNDFPLVRSEARGALTRALRVASHPARRHVIDKMLRVLQASSQGPITGVLAPIPMEHVILQIAADRVCTFLKPCDGDGVVNASTIGTKPAIAGGNVRDVSDQEASAAEAHSGGGSPAMDVSPATSAHPAAGAGQKTEVSYEQMMGAADLLRSRAVSPLVMREWGFFAPAGKAVLAALLAAERPDAAAVVGGLFAKLAMLVRPLTLEDFALRPADFLSPTAWDASSGDDVRMFLGVPSGDPDVSALNTFTDYTHFLLGLSKSGSTGVDVRAKPSGQLVPADTAGSFRTMEAVEEATSSVPIAPVAASSAVAVSAGDASGEPSSLMVREARLTTSTVSVGPDAAPRSSAIGVIEPAAVSRTVVENKSASDAHWRLQSLVASTLYMGLRGERVTEPAVARLFAYGMVSDVVMLRQIACHAIALILALHVKRAAARTIVREGGQTGAGNSSVLVSSLAGRAGHVDDDVLEADAAEVEAVLQQPDFTRKLVHTLALDHSDEGGAGGRDRGHCLSLLSLSRYVDGDLCWSMTGGPPWPSSWVLRSRDGMSLARVRLYEGLMRVFGVSALDAFAPVMDALLPTDGSNGDGIVGVTAENVRLVAAEVVAGMSCGLRYVDALSPAEVDDSEEPSVPLERHGRLASAADVERVAEWAWLLLERFSGPDGVDNGGTFIRLIASSARGRLGRLVNLRLADRILPPTDGLSDSGDASLLDQSAVAHVQARRLRYAHALVADAQPGSQSSLVVRYVTAVAVGLTTADSFGHPLKTVREEVARCMGLASSFCRSECREVLSAAVDRLVQRLMEQQKLINAAEVGTSPGDASDGAGVEMTDAEPTAAVSASNEVSPSAHVDSEKSTQDTRKKQRSREGETLSRWVTLVQWNGESHAFGPILCSVLPVLFDSVDDSDQDRVDHARQALSLAAQARLDDDDLSRVIGVCVATAKSMKWRVRGSVLPYLQVVGFTRLFVGREVDMRSLLDAVVALLSDEQLDVREAAAHTLVPLLRDAPPAAVVALRVSFLNKAKRSRKRVLRLRRVVRAERAAAIAAAGGSSGSSAAGDAGGSGGVTAAAPSTGPADLAAALVVQHGAVLGLGALLLSSPYAVPPWMPPVLLALTQCIDDMPPVSTTARKLFADFWRTHRDEWSAQREAFTADELEQVSELLISPSYYA